jgi:uncharacterized protein (DUF1778 family)
MATRRKPSKDARGQHSGGRRLMESGRKPMLLGLQPGERSVIERAARQVELPMTTFVLAAAVKAAEKILGISAKNA